MRGEWYFLLLGIGGVFFGIRTFLRSTRGKQLWDRWKLKLPIFGPLVHKICMSRFARTFAQLIRSGVPILEVLDIVGGSSGNHVVETAIKKLAPMLKKATTFPSRFHAKAFSRRCSCAWSQRAKPPARSTPCSKKWRTFGTKKSKQCSMRLPR